MGIKPSQVSSHFIPVGYLPRLETQRRGSISKQWGDAGSGENSWIPNDPVGEGPTIQSQHDDPKTLHLRIFTE